ncbi:MAG: hypothetical protein ABI193_04465 [Minicystis sp.]
MTDQKLAVDDARRLGQHEEVKAQVEGGIQAEIAEHANQRAPGESQKIAQVAGALRSKALTEVVDTENEVGTARTVARISQFVDYLFYVLYALLALRFLLALLAARSSAGFVKLIVALTDPFYGPFRGIIASHSLEGVHTLVLPLLVATVVYVLIHLAINGLLRLFAQRKTAL